MNVSSDSRKLIHTEQGKKWLAQFDPLDQGTAIRLANSLTLVSHTEFRRNLIDKIEEKASEVDGVVALFAIRELDELKLLYSKPVPIRFYKQVASQDGKTVNPLSATSDQGSEAIIANIIRNICKSDPKKFLNHPTIESMREAECRAIVFVDDFIGSGNRAWKFLSSFWVEPTITSWLSLKYIRFYVVAYSGTEDGISRVSKHKSEPQISTYRPAPTFRSMPWSKETKNEIEKLCQKYGRIANKKRRNMWMGYNKVMSTLVFEHGCPNNTPSILWEPGLKNSNWTGLFPNRTISPSTLSVFPPEIVRGDPIQILQDVGQTRLASSGSLLRRGEVGQTILLLLALIAKGRRKRSTLCFATGLNSEECERILEKCIRWRFLTPQKRLTKRGLAEINAARKSKEVVSKILEKGSNYYYPRQLRGTARG